MSGVTVERIERYLDGILHGDEEHREWLEEATYNYWYYNKAMPTPRGSGTKDRLYKEIERLRKENEELKSKYEQGSNGNIKPK